MRASRVDLGVAVVAVGLDVILFTQLSDDADQVSWVSRSIPAGVLVVAGLAAVPLLSVRRKAPTAVCLGLAAHAVLVTLTLGSRPLASLLVALYTVAVWSSRARALACLGAVLGAHALAVIYEASFSGTGLSGFAVLAVSLVYGLLALATFAAGRWGASAAARARARELERSRALLAAEAVNAERLRIARELHDIVAHAVTVMVLQAAGAQRMAVKSPALACEAMQAVQTGGQQAISELRRLLAVLRASDDAGERPGGDASVDAETSRLSQLDVLTQQVRAAGMGVAVQTHGSARPLDPSVDLAAYRVVQEGLTNASKHAGPGARARVTLTWHPDELMVDVVDDGQPVKRTHRTSPPGGYGLVGLTERVTLVGGRLTAGERPHGGFSVSAVLPTSGIPATEFPASGSVVLLDPPNSVLSL